MIEVTLDQSSTGANSRGKNVIFVAGMHRSGTSAFARFLNLLGPALPDQLIPGVMDNNEFGFWESRQVIAINDRILADRGIHWDGSPAETANDVQDQRLIRSEYECVIKRLLIKAGAGHKDVVIKDPRLCRALGIWTSAATGLGCNSKILIPYRHPLEVAASLEKRDGFDLKKALDIWLEYNMDSERGSREFPRCFVSFESLLGDWTAVADKISEQLQVPLEIYSPGAKSEIDQFLISAGRHHVAKNEKYSKDVIPIAVTTLYTALERLESDPKDKAAKKSIDQLWGSDYRLKALSARRDSSGDNSLLRQNVVSSHVYLNLLREAREGSDRLAPDIVSEGEVLSQPRPAAEGGPGGESAGSGDKAIEDNRREIEEENQRLQSELADARVRLDEFPKVLESLMHFSEDHRGEIRVNANAAERQEDDSRSRRISGGVRNSAARIIMQFVSIALWAEYAVRARIYRFPRLLIWAARLRRSGLFDFGRYRSSLNGRHKFANDFTLALHYCVYGDDRGRVPNPYFDLDYYLHFHGEAVGGTPAFVHYVSIGQGLDLSPNPILDTGRYLSVHPYASGKVLLEYIGTTDRDDGSLHPLFSKRWYQRTNPDVSRSGVDPLKHFMQFGWKEGRNPHPLFDTRYYLESYPDVKESGTNPLVHYLVYGFRERRNPHPIFDSAFYASRARIDLEQDPLLHYLETGWVEGHDPHPLFSTTWYKNRYPAVEAAGIPPLLHFVEADGGFEFDPGPWFSSRSYHKRYPESQTEERNALLHYLTIGCFSGNEPAPWFDAQAYLRQYPDVAQSCDVSRAFGHFIRSGQYEGRDAAPKVSMADKTEAAAVRTRIATLTWEEGPGTEEFVEESDEESPPQTFTEIIAWYLPQFHPIPENDKWWGKGFTEWRNVTRGKSRFTGHYQPRRPDALGYYDLRVPEVLEQQVQLAKKYGISAFCFHYYWFGGKRLLDLPLKRFVKNKSLDLGFCVSWANENWTRTWDGLENDVLLAQEYSEEDDIGFIDSVIPLFDDDRYIRIDGKPLLIVYRPSLLPDAKATSERWRERCREKGVGEVLLGFVQFERDNPRLLGFDVAIEFPPHKLGRELARIDCSVDVVDPQFSGAIYEYADLVKRGKALEAPHYPLIRGVCPSWDNEARRPGKGTTYHGSTPKGYREWLEYCCAYAHQYPVHGREMVFVNAWNEWAEAAYLEPDRRFGFAYLEATREAATRTYEHWQSIPRKRKIVLVTHDMHNHGAQQNALYMARSLARHFHYEVVVLTLGSGELWKQFEEVATVIDFRDERHEYADRMQQLGALRAREFEAALVNTTVAGMVVPMLKDAGFIVTCMVHELPTLVREYGLGAHIKAISNSADTIVFAANIVRDAFLQQAPHANEKCVVRPQGLYKFPPSVWSKSEARATLASRHGVPDEAEIILAVGWADLRKGVDIFVRAAISVCKKRPDARFIWLGVEAPELLQWLKLDLEKLGLEKRVLLLARSEDVGTYYAAADLYFLCSREDPFPSVALEAMSYGIPIVAFEDATGCADIISSCAGITVPYFDERAAADAICELLSDFERRQSLGRTALRVIAREYDWNDYIHFLLETSGMPEAKISVVVPNYNYAHFLPRRLKSIYEQRHPIHEVIVLDDASDDESIELLDSLRTKFDPEFRVVVNSKNSKSVFRQWRKGLEEVTGEYVWIAEADDVSHSDFLDHVVTPMLNDPNIVISYCESKQISEDGSVLAPDYRNYVKDISADKWMCSYVSSGQTELASALIVKNTIPNVSACVFRAEHFRKVLSLEINSICKLSVAGDYKIYVHLLDKGNISYNCVSLNYHCRGEGGVTRSAFGSRKLIDEITMVQKEVQHRCRGNSKMIGRAKRYISELEKQFGLL